MEQFLCLLFALSLSFWIYSQIFQYWYLKRTKGDAYFKQTLYKRQAFIKTLKHHAYVLTPFYAFMAKGIKHKKLAGINYQQNYFPAATCTQQSLNDAHNYKATANDIFVVSFMKSGTSWLQNIVFEILHHGEGHFDDEHYPHLYAISPWLESSGIGSVSVKDAPLISSYQKRIIKTHLSATLCPHDSQAKYLYIERNPVDTFTSCVHFFNKMAGPFCPDITTLGDFFCSDDMFWGAWPNHTQGWKTKALTRHNVLYLHYDELLHQPLASISRISEFLHIPLSTDNMQKVLRKTEFSYMKKNDVYFEMAPPNIFSINSQLSFFNSKETPSLAIHSSLKQRIATFCGTEQQQ